MCYLFFNRPCILHGRLLKKPPTGRVTLAPPMDSVNPLFQIYLGMVLTVGWVCVSLHLNKRSGIHRNGTTMVKMRKQTLRHFNFFIPCHQLEFLVVNLKWYMVGPRASYKACHLFYGTRKSSPQTVKNQMWVIFFKIKIH